MKERQRIGIRRNAGSTVIDVAVGAIVAIALTVLALDLVLFTIGYTANDAAARDAARAAGTADSPANANLAATTACSAHHTDGILITQPVVDNAQFHFDSFTSPQPFVYVTTDAQMKLPGCELFSPGNSGQVSTVRQYVFPALSFTQVPPSEEMLAANDIISSALVPLPRFDGSVPGAGSSDSNGSNE